MDEVRTQASSALFGNWGYLGVSRGLGEFQACRPVLVTAGSDAVLALPVEGLDARRLAEFRALCGAVAPCLVITKRRAQALGLNASAPIEVSLSTSDDAAAILALVQDAASDRALQAKPAGSLTTAAIHLVKLSQGLPAVLAARIVPGQLASADRIVHVDPDEVARFADHASRSLTLASDAAVPLSSGSMARFVVFRDAMGGSQVAILVGEPDFAGAVPVRLHSACLTGDVFGSRRCDCGDQLRLALTRLDELGGGVILYLAQEGRGLGLANKMRTYTLQDEGLDTIDANTTLGFDDDERDYGIAASMLQMLACTRVILLTNNPAKLEGLTKAGIEISGRMPLEAPINADNRRYMTAKAIRSGHRFDLLADRP